MAAVRLKGHCSSTSSLLHIKGILVDFGLVSIPLLIALSCNPVLPGPEWLPVACFHMIQDD